MTWSCRATRPSRAVVSPFWVPASRCPAPGGLALGPRKAEQVRALGPARQGQGGSGPPTLTAGAGDQHSGSLPASPHLAFLGTSVVAPSRGSAWAAGRAAEQLRAIANRPEFLQENGESLGRGWGKARGEGVRCGWGAVGGWAGPGRDQVVVGRCRELRKSSLFPPPRPSAGLRV